MIEALRSQSIGCLLRLFAASCRCQRICLPRSVATQYPYGRIFRPRLIATKWRCNCGVLLHLGRDGFLNGLRLRRGAMILQFLLVSAHRFTGICSFFHFSALLLLLVFLLPPSSKRKPPQCLVTGRALCREGVCGCV